MTDALTTCRWDFLMPAPVPLLAHLSTRWTWLNMAHSGPPAAARSAVGWLVERYRPAAVRYLRGAVRDPDAAEDLFQEFTVRLTRGDFRSADPGRGRFRDFLRTALARLAADHYRGAARRPAQGPVPDPADPRARPRRRQGACGRLPGSGSRAGVGRPRAARTGYRPPLMHRPATAGRSPRRAVRRVGRTGVRRAGPGGHAGVGAEATHGGPRPVHRGGRGPGGRDPRRPDPGGRGGRV